MRTTNPDLIHAQVKSRLNSGNVCYHSVQNLLSVCLVPNSVKIEICGTVILLIVLYLASDIKGRT
jgi:hypothetical protein